MDASYLGNQTIKIYINNFYIGTIQSSHGNKTQIHFNVNFLKINGINTVKFEYSNAHKPGNGDQRLLAIAFEAFGIK